MQIKSRTTHKKDENERNLKYFIKNVEKIKEKFNMAQKLCK